jgi:uncharacterized protein YcbK (DUF882 family)
MSDRVSPHFTRKEFTCPNCDCNFGAVDVQLLEILEKVRTHFNAPVKITSACRCLKKNRDIGSKDSSQHVKGVAADIKVKGVTPQEVYDYLDQNIDPPGLGRYDTFTHVDVRIGSYARWDSTHA